MPGFQLLRFGRSKFLPRNTEVSVHEPFSVLATHLFRSPLCVAGRESLLTEEEEAGLQVVKIEQITVF